MPMPSRKVTSHSLGYCIAMLAVAATLTLSPSAKAEGKQPNVLIAISDDQSFPHASAYGDPVVQTPGFDRVAKAGVLFNNAFTPAPGCSPMRAAFLTGREIWQNEHAGTHASFFPTHLPVFTNQLAQAGYHVGMTGKGWGPGRHPGWEHNPAGKSYSGAKSKAPKGISGNNYAANFDRFLESKPDDRPFCFWFGSHEPHRSYDKGIGKRSGMDLSKVQVPPFLPDTDEVRSDIADYLYEIQWFDQHLQRMLDRLSEAGELDNTLVIVTSDNGMPFPRAKANVYEYGIHMPLAISWPQRIRGGQTTDDLVSLIDVTKTIFAAAEVTPQKSEQMPGVSLLGRYSDQAGKVAPPRREVFSGRERHSSSRFNSLGYPCRCIRTKTHLYIRNFKPQRWPAGTPQKYDRATYDDSGKLVDSRLGGAHGGYHDIDNGPTLQHMIARRNESRFKPLFDFAVALRPVEELYNIVDDPGCLNNLATSPASNAIKTDLSNRLTNYLVRTGDLRQTDPKQADVWETYPRVSGLRWFPTPEWAEASPELVPDQPWLEERRPRKKND